jgi:hypothetical protein
MYSMFWYYNFTFQLFEPPDWCIGSCMVQYKQWVPFLVGSDKDCNIGIVMLLHAIFNEIMTIFFVLANALSWIHIALAYWNNSLQVDISPYLDTLSLLWCLSLLHHNAKYWKENQHIPMLQSLSDPTRNGTHCLYCTIHDPIHQSGGIG